MKIVRIIRAVIDKYNRDNGNLLAASLAYYTLFSIFPLILGLVAIAGFLVPSNGARDNLIHAIAQQFPGSSSLIESTIQQIIEGRGAAGIVATLGLIWGASGVFSALTVSLDRIVGAWQPRGFVGSTLLALSLVFGVGLLFVASLVVSTILRIAFTTRLPVVGITLNDVPVLYAVVGLALPLLITFLAFAFLYHFVPSVHLEWNNIWPGALLAAVAFELAKQVFVLYLGSFAQFNAVYGSIGAVIILLTWAYYAAIVILVGAEFNVVLNPPKQPPGKQKFPTGKVA
ncbi:MAG TPA: YihY/virulence factor BrkB family protein [Chloroflexota bacterium]|nr:YihY/virulence factor BrkB family protein [Chloroflexota bacterium]